MSPKIDINKPCSIEGFISALFDAAGTCQSDAEIRPREQVVIGHTSPVARNPRIVIWCH